MLKLAGAAAGLFVALAAAPASAQVPGLTEAQEAEMFCVFDELGVTGDEGMVAEAYIFTDLTEEEMDEAEAAFDGSVTSCAEDYEWSEAEMFLAGEIGLFQTVTEYLRGDLLGSDVSEATIFKMGDVMKALPDADLQKFADASWLDDLTFQARIKKMLMAEGLPDDQFALDSAIDMMEASLLLADAVMSWVDGVK